jgi:hypothetical protein
LKDLSVFNLDVTDSMDLDSFHIAAKEVFKDRNDIKWKVVPPPTKVIFDAKDLKKNYKEG